MTDVCLSSIPTGTLLARAASVVHSLLNRVFGEGQRQLSVPKSLCPHLLLLTRPPFLYLWTSGSLFRSHLNVATFDLAPGSGGLPLLSQRPSPTLFLRKQRVDFRSLSLPFRLLIHISRSILFLAPPPGSADRQESPDLQLTLSPFTPLEKKHRPTPRLCGVSPRCGRGNPRSFPCVSLRPICDRAYWPEDSAIPDDFK